MAALWTVLDPPDCAPPPVKVRGAAYLAASDNPDFPDSVPHADDSVLRVSPARPCRSPDVAGKLARSVIDHSFESHPAILFKNCPIRSRQDFSRFMAATGLRAHDYKGGNALRDKSGDKVSITSTEHPDVVVTPHNENAYMPEPPSMIFFCCLNPADEGGEVPINDVRKTPDHLPQDFVSEMRKRDLRYIRRMRRDDSRYEIGWKTSFGTSSKQEIEDYLSEQHVCCRWGGDDTLEFWFNTPVFKTYRGQEIWFNQLSESNADYWLWHPDIDEMGYTRETCQSDTAYGDGEQFPAKIRTMVRAAIWRTTEVLKMEASDIILLDNHLMQHGRMAYKGDRRHLASLVK